ncbi:MAG: WD40 repeat domain-containing protein [Anaerolineaceae bacterium]|nr:WD40 repeat domain-containing protein [Anaerolineaceae bacterium]
MRATLAFLLLLLVSGPPLAAQGTLVITAEGPATAFACVEADCERLAWLPGGAEVTVIGQAEGRELEGSTGWIEVLLDCPCFDYELRFLENAPAVPVSDEGTWSLWQPRWSFDGSRIAAVVDTNLYVWDAASGTLLTQDSHAPFTLLPPAWSPKGPHMVLTGIGQGERKSLLLLLDANGQVLQSPGEYNGWIAGAAWSPDGSRIATVGDELHLWDVNQQRSLFAMEASAIAMHWSPDGERIVTINHGGEAAQLRDASNGQLLFSLGEESGGQLPFVDWSPDGERIVTIDVLAGSIHVWNAADGQLVSTLDESDSGYVIDANWSPDGKYLLYALTADLSGKLRRWSGREQDPPRTLFDSDQGILDFSLSPDGRFLVAGIEGEVRILDSADGQQLATLWQPDIDQRPWFSGHVAWSPDGLRVAAAETVHGRRSPVGMRNSVASVWDLTLIPEGPTRAFIHSSRLGAAAAEDR